MDLIKWTTVISLVKLGYSDKNSEILNTYYRVHLSQDSAKTSWKGLTKMQNLLSKSNDKPLDTDCKVCFDGTITDANPIVYCDKYSLRR